MTSKHLSTAKLFLYLMLGGILSASGITVLSFLYWLICVILLAIDYLNSRIAKDKMKRRICTTEVDYSTIEDLLCNLCEN
jgi:hypothetical protein